MNQHFLASDGIKDPEYSSRIEWLETNGIGGFASSSIIGLNTRRYHGLLTAAVIPPVVRKLLLSKVEEILIVDGKRYELGSNRFLGGLFPGGHSLLEEFHVDPFPRWIFRAGEVQLTKTVFMPHGLNAVVIEYSVENLSPQNNLAVSLELCPLLAFRDFHSLARENGKYDAAVTIDGSQVSIRPYPELPELYFSHSGGRLRTTGHWYRDFELQEEKDRGLDHTEDLHNPFVLTFDAVSRVTLVSSDHPLDRARAEELRGLEIRRRKKLVASGIQADSLRECLIRAADQFLVLRGEGQTIIAGYPWFSDWGRDTMISLPGLTLATGRYEAARGILKSFSSFVDQGMLPNRFPDQGEEPEYNTVDATLWYFEAIRDYVERTGDFDLVKDELYPVLSDIVGWHLRGTRYGIGADADGLLRSGEPGVQLTWMDAKVGDFVVTPRTGKPVEIQALWYNALMIFADFAGRIGDAERQALILELTRKIKSSFESNFWNQEIGCLYDVVEGEHRDASIRPNQIFAVSLHHSLLEGDRARAVVEQVRRHLLTPRGLRTLSPADPKYIGRYGGDVSSRDSAYHQGTVWPWLIGPFISAFLNVNEGSAESVEFVRSWLSEFAEHLREAGLGSISEVFDGDFPHRPGGCIAQAWSVAELLRVITDAPKIFE